MIKLYCKIATEFVQWDCLAVMSVRSRRILVQSAQSLTLFTHILAHKYKRIESLIVPIIINSFKLIFWEIAIKTRYIQFNLLNPYVEWMLVGGFWIGKWVAISFENGFEIQLIFDDKFELDFYFISSMGIALVQAISLNSRILYYSVSMFNYNLTSYTSCTVATHIQVDIYTTSAGIVFTQRDATLFFTLFSRISLNTVNWKVLT